MFKLTDIPLLLCLVLFPLTGAEHTTYRDLATKQVWFISSSQDDSFNPSPRRWPAAMSAGGSPGWGTPTSLPTRLWTAGSSTTCASCPSSSPTAQLGQVQTSGERITTSETFLLKTIFRDLEEKCSNVTGNCRCDLTPAEVCVKYTKFLK